MDVFDLQGKLSIDITPYLDALRTAARETERLRTQMSAPLAPPTVPGSTPSTPGSSPGGSPSSPGGSPLAPVVSDAEKAGQAIDDLNQKLGEGFATAAKVGAAAWATFSAAAVGATKKAVDGFAQSEQLVGGVDTLFKESSQTVQKYAEQAYKTAGMSANTYMQTITSFSASLLNSLDNDTEKAAEKANTAITDMADNSNKMGTSLESLTRAYMGFSRQNFTMLDNLALGFSGTKQGMQELLDKAEELSGIKYDISSYADIVDAIHVVQQEMGITGTTAKEASETIEGSMNSTKAALDNLLVGFARGDADIDKLMGDVETNITNLAKNAIPVAERAFVNLTKYAIEAGMKIANELPKLIRQATEDVHKMIASTFGEGANTIFGIEAALKAAAAAFVAFKAAAYVADVVDKIKALNTALQGTVTLSEAMKVANLANPWVLAAAAIAAATVGLKSWIDAQTDAIQEAVDSYDLLDDAQKQVYDGFKDLLTQNSEFKKKYQESSEALETNAARCSALSKELEELDRKEKLTGEDKVRMKAIVDDLNGSIDGLNVQINAETGHLETQISTIDELIRAYERQAEATVNQERLVELKRQQYKLEDSYNKAYDEHAQALRKVNQLEAEKINSQKEINRLNEKAQRDVDNLTDAEQKRYMQLNDRLLDIDEEIENAKSQSAQFAIAYSDIGDAYRENEKAINDIVTSMGKAVLSSETTAETFEKSAEKIGTSEKELTGIVVDENTKQITAYGELKSATVIWSENMIKSIASVIDEYVDYRESVEKSIKGSVDIFDDFKRDTSITFDDLYNKMADNKAGIEDWTLAIQQLRQKGKLDDRLIDQWEEMGVASWGYIRALNWASLEQQEAFNNMWLATQGSMDKAVHQAVSDDKKQYDKLLEELTGESGVKLGEYRKTLDSFVTEQADTYLKGIDNAVEAAKKAAEDVQNALNDVDSEGAAQSVMERYAATIAEMGASIAEAAGAFGTSMFTGGKTKIESSQVNAVNTADRNITINLSTELDGETIARKTVNYYDDLQGKKALKGTRGYAL